VGVAALVVALGLALLVALVVLLVAVLLVVLPARGAAHGQDQRGGAEAGPLEEVSPRHRLHRRFSLWMGRLVSPAREARPVPAPRATPCKIPRPRLLSIKFADERLPACGFAPGD